MAQAPRFLAVMAATHGLYAESYLKRLAELGAHVTVLTREGALNDAWPRGAIAGGVYAVPSIFDPAALRRAVGYLFRERRFDRIVGPGEYDIDLAAELREYFRLPGMSASGARLFRDKLAMRVKARETGIPVPDFTAVHHRPDVAAYLTRVSGPWLLKPRTQASSNGIRTLRSVAEVWAALDALGDAAPDYLLERYVPGSVFHVDAAVINRQVRFASAHRYGTPILDLHQAGGIYTTHRLQAGTPDELSLLALNAEVLGALGLQDGVAHVEFIQSAKDGQFLFLEAAARVGAGLIDTLVERESGLDLWATWAEIEVAEANGEIYRLPPVSDRYAGVLATAVGVPSPDPRPFLDAHVHAVAAKPYHLGLVVEGDAAHEVEARLEALASRIRGSGLVRHVV